MLKEVPISWPWKGLLSIQKESQALNNFISILWDAVDYDHIIIRNMLRPVSTVGCSFSIANISCSKLRDGLFSVYHHVLFGLAPSLAITPVSLESQVR